MPMQSYGTPSNMIGQPIYGGTITSGTVINGGVVEGSIVEPTTTEPMAGEGSATEMTDDSKPMMEDGTEPPVPPVSSPGPEADGT